MDTTDMLIKAHATSAASATANPGEETAGTCWSDDLSPTVEAMTLEELDVGGSEFSWSTVASETAIPISDTPTAISNPTLEGEVAVAEAPLTQNQSTASTRTRTEHASAPSIQKHSLYFWESITFQVEGVVFQLPKYRFVEDSEVFMEMVTTSEGDGVIELDVTLVEFESFLKAFLPRTSAMYDPEPILTKDEWISVLKLSSKWLFNDLRQLAIEHLHFPFPHPGYWHITDPIERICLAKEYNVYDWLLDGYEQVVERLINFDDPDGEPRTLTTQDGKRIGMEVALELSGIAIRRMRLAERKVPLRDTRSDVLDAFKQEFDCVREEGARFMTRSERLEEARKKAEEEAEVKHAKEAEEKERQKLNRETEIREEAEKELKRQEEGRRISLAKRVEMLNSAEVPTLRLGRKAGRRVKREEAKDPKLGQECANPLSSGNAQPLEGEEADRIEEERPGQLEREKAKQVEEEEIKQLKVEIAKRLEEEEMLEFQKWERKREEEKDKKLQVLAEEELKKRRASPEEGKR
ncbi:hypothetical protein BKA70DRAFT_1570743 [Coprinopsis sp. MPI-PUGE-AT-0042]|nr:hypothetical protein BKA70DRAFT_1570743 [Coprinopsis sp. MPI-PUGE-AT-0042]